MSSQIITIIGGGNMGSSLIGGLIKKNHPPENIWATDTDEDKLNTLKEKYAINVTNNNAEAILPADIVILAIKPQLFPTVVTPLAPLFKQQKPLIISIAAGLPVTLISKLLDGDLPIVRAMPNTPALIGCGACGLFANDRVTAKERQSAETILGSVGMTVWLDDESLLDTVTALSGSGPAYFFLMMEALEDAAVQLGLTKDIARALTLQTALGAARMAIESDKPPIDLRVSVTSKGGTTEKAVSILEANHFRDIFKHALEAAKLRAQELASAIGEKK